MDNEAAQAEKITENQTHLVSTFCEITSSSKEEALFFLESHNYDLDLAVSTFLETTAAADADASDHNLPRSRSPSPSPSRSRSPSPRPNPYDLRSRKPMASSSSNRRTSGGPTGRIRTLSDLNRQAKDDASDSDSDEPQEYYTGGEKSGMLVQDPSKANNVDAIFNQARQFGAVEKPADDPHPSSNSKSFTGTGRLLSGETVSPAAQAAQQPQVVTHNIVFWSNGFAVDDGPLRRLDDPENASFLESIRKSECPKELEPADRRIAVHVNLTRKEQNFPEPEKRQIPFQGAGRTLGSASSTTPMEAAAAASLNTAPPPSVGLVVDDTSPSTSIQLRLADGTRMVSRFNYHHSIRDIRAFIDASRPSGARTYQLQTVGFPPKQLTDLEQTIEQAGLANSVVIQKL
ncbi:plant UBX domain-containing protein 4-like [Cornus florida]|uniref:plant UBX domain-containing protein 4-like n=1 Tax=Cornus florida TaxID=4283 RepID=UPI0028A1B191|nr:plant UBX domain-containing protein 4-like [Cornus florida]